MEKKTKITIISVFIIACLLSGLIGGLIGGADSVPIMVKEAVKEEAYSFYTDTKFDEEVIEYNASFEKVKGKSPKYIATVIMRVQYTETGTSIRKEYYNLYKYWIYRDNNKYIVNSYNAVK